MIPTNPESPSETKAAPVVLVEDSLFDSTLARRAYERSWLENPLVVLSNGRELIDYLNSVKNGTCPRPELILLDIHMEGTDGLETLRQIRDQPDFRQSPPIIMLTNSDEPEDRDRAARNGADGYQVKPPSPSDMVEFFNAMPLRPSRPEEAN